MNYCLLEDAWSDYKKDETINHDSSDKVIEHFDINYDIAGNLTTNIKPIEKHIREDHIQVYSCDDFIKHLGSCRHCRMRLQNNLRSQNVSSRILISLKNIILNNKDTVVLLLIILFIIIFIKLIISVFRR